MDNTHFNRLSIIILLMSALTTFHKVAAQSKNDQLFIYGEIHTIDNVYKGYIRWGSEEAYWFDYFNASKLDNISHHEKSDTRERKKSSWSDFDWSLSSIWEDKKYQTRHEFTCQFGDISEIRLTGSNNATVILKNGTNIKVDGSGYNDLGGTVSVMDEEIGNIKIRWSKIDKIVFKTSDKTESKPFGSPVFGTVKTYRKGDFTGYIQWDHDERVGTDKLDGKSSDGDISIAFDKIMEITKSGNGSKVRLSSGREFYLTNSNDVNSQNRGIIVMSDEVGEIDIPWKDMETVSFTSVDNKDISYSAFSIPKEITGKVYLHDNTTLDGKIIYDMDETWEIETLEANDDNIKYRIPFRNISSITPKNYDYSMITLRNGQTLLIGGKRDVSDSNDGLLVMEKGKPEPVYVPWKSISEIILN